MFFILPIPTLNETLRSSWQDMVMVQSKININIKNVDGHVIICIHEDITLSRLPGFREYLKNNQPQTYESLWINLSNVSYIDSAGISFLLGTLSKARTSKKPHGVINPQPMVKKVFEIAHLSKAIPIVESETQAIRPVTDKNSPSQNHKESDSKGGSSILSFFRRSK